MKFYPEKCKIEDSRMIPFIDADELHNILLENPSSPEKVKTIIAKSLNKERLSLAETAVLLNTEDAELIKEIKLGAKLLKERVYGNRIVLFAPLYIGNKCSNNCSYCGFRASNTKSLRKTLEQNEIIKEVEALEDNGQKRLILVFGEHKDYSAEYIAETVKTVYSVKRGNGEIRRLNINAAPFDINGFRIVKDSGIGTYQVFQETYHPETYKKYHLSGKKSDFNWRLTSLDRAQEAGLDDCGIGVLFGLYDWKYEVLGLLRHVNHLEAVYNVGPHTISFPRIKQASDMIVDKQYIVNDEEFVRIIAILRLAVPYTGLILTARENPEVRKEVLSFGVSQIDGGTKLELGSYSKSDNDNQDLNKEQFAIADSRSLAEVIEELLENDYLPSFCTACYRKGRTGEHFMEFSVPGFIKRFCTPNGILTLAEYLIDYAPQHVQEKGWKIIEKNLLLVENPKIKDAILNKLELIKQGKRDIYF